MRTTIKDTKAGDIDRHGKCPKCEVSWDGGDMSEAVRIHYTPPYKWSRLLGIEDPLGYDGISWYKCPDCFTQWDRWTGDEVLNK